MLCPSWNLLLVNNELITNFLVTTPSNVFFASITGISSNPSNSIVFATEEIGVSNVVVETLRSITSLINASLSFKNTSRAVIIPTNFPYSLTTGYRVCPTFN